MYKLVNQIFNRIYWWNN